MKKRFELTSPKKEPQRVLEAIKHEIRKYIKREKRKPLPKGMDIWNINCKFAKDEDEVKEISFQDITKSLDEAAQSGAKSIYIELISNGVKKEPKIVEETKIEDTIQKENTEDTK